MRKLVVHVAEVELSEESGMGRVAAEWKKAFEARGYDFIHIGPLDVERMPHRGYLTLFPYLAYRAYSRLGRRADVFLVHEPSARPFVGKGVPVVLVSHGIERRWWAQYMGFTGLRTKILFPATRLRDCEHGLHKADKVFLLNTEDLIFAKERYKRDPKDLFLFRNGVYPSGVDETGQPDEDTVLFAGTWIMRKGTRTLVEAANTLHGKGLKVRWLLAGTRCPAGDVLNDWPKAMHSSVEVLPDYNRDSEEKILSRGSVFVLPSLFEGQPLALLQAMEAGRCCITTDCCGQRDVVTHGVNGLLFKPGDSRRLSEMIEGCILDRQLRLRLGRNAKLSMRGRDWGGVTSEIVDKAEEIMSGRV